MQEYPTSIWTGVQFPCSWVPDYFVDSFLSLQNLSLNHCSIADEVCVCYRQRRDTAYKPTTKGKVRSILDRREWPKRIDLAVPPRPPQIISLCFVWKPSLNPCCARVSQESWLYHCCEGQVERLAGLISYFRLKCKSIQIVLGRP